MKPRRSAFPAGGARTARQCLASPPLTVRERNEANRAAGLDVILAGPTDE